MILSEKEALAKHFAEQAHGSQMYGDKPYVSHLSHVNEVLKRFGITDESLLVASFLHDSVEDTEMKLEHIHVVFGREVSDLVYRVTNEPGKNRKERHEKTYPKIQASDDAITLKLADRIANVETSIEQNNPILEMYKKEHDAFRAILFKQGTHDAMWRHLDFLIGGIERSGAW